MTEEGEVKLDTNINYLLEEFGIACNSGENFGLSLWDGFPAPESLVLNEENPILWWFEFAISDAVIRSVYYKYFDPKEALISNGVLNRALGAAAGKHPKSAEDLNAQSLAFVYPFGATLSLDKQHAVALFSTGTVCYPVKRPVAAFHQAPTHDAGKVAVVGSVHMFSDAYFDKEENAKVFVCFPSKDFSRNSGNPCRTFWSSFWAMESI